MKHLAIMTSVLFILGLGAVVPGAVASTRTPSSSYTTFSTHALIGSSVCNPQGTLLGIVDGIMIDPDGHAYAIVNNGDADLSGSGGVDTPVPIAALRITKQNSGQAKIVLNTDTEHMDFAPFLNPLKLDNMQYDANIYRYFGVQTHWGSSSHGQTVAEVYDVIGASVKNPHGKLLGSVDRVIIDSEGHAFAIINHGDSDLYGPGPSDINTPVPFAALRISQTKSGQEKIILNMDTTHLDLAPHSNPVKIANAQSPYGYYARIYAYYGVQPYWNESTYWQMPNKS
jgi:hypothetical protein